MVAIVQALAAAPSALPSDPSARDAAIAALKRSISALEICIEKLGSRSSPWEIVAVVASLIVVVGVAGELVVIVSEYREDLHAWRWLEWLPNRPPLWRFRFEIAATCLVVAGVLGEAWASFDLASINNSLRSKTTELMAESGQLGEWASQIAGEANERAASADLKRAQLENRIADIFGPRYLTPEQSARIAARLRNDGRLNGTKVDVYVYGVDNPYNIADFEDSHGIALAVVHTLKLAKLDAAGWLLQSCQGSEAYNIVVTTTGQGNIASAFASGSDLIKAFQPEIGTDPDVEPNIFPPAWCQKTLDLDARHPNHRKNDATITIIVGRKVQPILTREMLEPDSP